MSLGFNALLRIYYDQRDYNPVSGKYNTNGLVHEHWVIINAREIRLYVTLAQIIFVSPIIFC